MTPKKGTPTPKYKLDAVKELTELVKNKKTILVASIKDIPASQFQEIGKKLRGKAIVKVLKKSLMFRAIDSSGEDAVKKLRHKTESVPKSSQMSQLKEHVGDSVAVLFSNLDSFELSSELQDSKSPAKAKAGQEAPEDIEIPEGPTDLVPGPAISELGALGIQIKIEKGKIHIKEAKVIAKQGEKISQGAAALMSKLDIKPFSIGFIPICAFDTKEGKLYLDIKIDKQGTIGELKTAYNKALGFAVEIGYTSEDTIKFLIGKANAQANKIKRIITGEPQGWASTSSRLEPVAEVVEEKVEENVKESKQEEKAPAAEGLGALFG